MPRLPNYFAPSRTNCLVRQTLADDSTQRPICTLFVIDTPRHAVGIAEIELRQIAVQVLLAAMLVHALHAALENAVVAFNRVGADRTTSPSGAGKSMFAARLPSILPRSTPASCSTSR